VLSWRAVLVFAVLAALPAKLRKLKVDAVVSGMGC